MTTEDLEQLNELAQMAHRKCAACAEMGTSMSKLTVRADLFANLTDDYARLCVEVETLRAYVAELKNEKD
jgi:hypothetical protein